MRFRKEPMQVGGDFLPVPGIAAEAEDQGSFPANVHAGLDVHPMEPLAVLTSSSRRSALGGSGPAGGTALVGNKHAGLGEDHDER